MIDFFHSSGNSSLFRIELIRLWISERNILPPDLINSTGMWSVPADLCLFRFLITISNSKSLGSGTSGSAVCISVCQTSLNPCTLRVWEEMFLHLDKIMWQSVTKSPFSSFIILGLAWLTLLKIFDILGLTLIFKVFNFSSQLFLLFPEISTNFTSYIA